MSDSFMMEAIRLADSNMIGANGGPFGAIIVKNGEIIGRGSNQVSSTNDPTAHAEVTAIRDACKHLNSFKLEGCEIYTSCEPCPMCLTAIYWARIDTIFYGAGREDAAKIGFDDRYFYEQVSLPIEERSIPMIQTHQQPAVDVFTKWDKKADKILY